MSDVQPLLSEKGPRERVLAAIDSESLTWEFAGTQTRHRLYSSEYDYRTLTPSEKKHLDAMLEAGEIRKVQGWRFGIGGYERVTVDAR